MRRSILSLTFTAIVLSVALTSCLKDKDYLYSETAMYTVIGSEKLQTDTGLTYLITENDAGTIPSTMKRVMARCEVLRANTGSEDTYEVRLKEFVDTKYIEPVRLSGSDPSSLGEDGISLYQGWVSGGYLNAQYLITEVYKSTTQHDVNLVLDDVRSHSDTLFFNLRHNAHGESFDYEDVATSTLSTSSYYASFPIRDIMAEEAQGKSSITIHLEWDWFVSTGDNMMVRDKEKHEGDIIVSLK